MSETPAISIHVGGRAVQVWPQVSERARRVRIAVKPGPKVVLSYPSHTSPAAALAFLKDNLAWLEKALARARPVQASLVTHFEKFPWVTLGDRLWELSVESGGRTKVQLLQEFDKIVLTLPSEAPEAGAARAVRRLAETGLNLAVERLATRVGVQVEQVSVRDQTTRWGSCSASGVLSLNWRLILLPPLIHDHVILHELAHRRHMDHSDNFWRQLAAWDKDWRHHDRELTKRWGSLMDLGRA
jgi:predicted metal-dependent hydrolase